MEFKYTKEDLKTMQNWSLERKIQVTQTRIIEWIIKWGGTDKAYISFSGGKDSTVLLDLARRIYPDIQAVFIDTGLEYPELREFVKTIPNVTWLKPEMNFRKVIETYGYPLISKEVSLKIDNARKGGCCEDDFIYGTARERRCNGGYSMTKWNFLKESNIPISDRCCNVMKKKPAKKFEKETGKHPIVGTLAVESAHRTQAWLKNGCNAFTAERPISTPMSFWTEQDVLQYIKEFNIPIASIYGEIIKDDNGKYKTTGVERSGCIFCAYGAHREKEPNRFQKLKQTHPQLWNYCMKPWNCGGLGMKKVLEFINVKTGDGDE